jgi:hypothetical protein
MKKTFFATAAVALLLFVLAACQMPMGSGGPSADGDFAGMSLANFSALSASTRLSGAIFTTLVDGTRVNANLYEAKEDVYLDGGPGPNAPAGAAGLPEGDYYFQVTDPSGKDLLSSDHVQARKIHVNADGVIDLIYQGYTYEKIQGEWQQVPAQHNEGIDIDHPELGAITVQLFPYDDTPNPGGVYKVWITRVEDYEGLYAGDDAYVPQNGQDKVPVNGENYQPGNYHGFIPAFSKTDNFKVEKKGKPYDSPEITVRKFHDANLNGDWDEGEEEVFGWAVGVVDPLSMVSTVFTAATVIAEPAGTWSFVEDTPAGTLQTVSFLDGATVSAYPAANPNVQVTVAGTSGETHEVVYGNIGLGSVTAFKIYDRDADGVADTDEPAVPGWKFVLTGTTLTGGTVGPIEQLTGADGTTTFSALLPGTYTVTEIIPADGGWQTVAPTSLTVTVESTLSGGTIAGTPAEAVFLNFCVGSADFGTKGYWHNKNGLSEILPADILYVNGLPPYGAPSSYFDSGDEPFDGFYADGTPVSAVNGEWGELIAPAGTALAEISHFLVDANAGADPREQLAQQLLAFIFNSLHDVDSPDAAIQLPDGSWTTASALITQAVAAWSGSDADAQHALQSLLDALNNSDALPFVHYYPCEVVY